VKGFAGGRGEREGWKCRNEKEGSEVRGSGGDGESLLYWLWGMDILG